jgi:hypothetical protein
MNTNVVIKAKSACGKNGINFPLCQNQMMVQFHIHQNLKTGTNINPNSINRYS